MGRGGIHWRGVPAPEKEGEEKWGADFKARGRSRSRKNGGIHWRAAPMAVGISRTGGWPSGERILEGKKRVPKTRRTPCLHSRLVVNVRFVGDCARCRKTKAQFLLHAGHRGFWHVEVIGRLVPCAGRGLAIPSVRRSSVAASGPGPALLPD